LNAPGPLPFPTDGHAPAGHRLGSFELRGVAARNDHGIVYRAWDHELCIAVAIKEYLPQHLARRDANGDVKPLGADTGGAFERGRDAFVDEARLLARCDHPSLVRVRQLLRAHGTVYRVMPWCQGWPLADLRREMTDPPDEPALRRLLEDVLGALEAWHRIGGPHGGVNPAKILLLDDDRALLLGPGRARRAADDAAGSPASAFGRSFVAPEQSTPSAQARCGPWTDFFALAHVVRYCISGMLPQADPSAAPESLSDIVKRLYFDAPGVRYDADFLQALDAAAAPAIGDRPQTASEFRDWLIQGPRPRLPVASPADQVASPADQAAPQADSQVDILLQADPPAHGAARAEASHASEAFDTVDLIRRVVESTPERHEAPKPAALPVFAAPATPMEDWPHAPWAPRPARRKTTGAWWLLGAVLSAACGYAVWAWDGSTSPSIEAPTAIALPSMVPAASAAASAAVLAEAIAEAIAPAASVPTEPTEPEADATATVPASPPAPATAASDAGGDTAAAPSAPSAEPETPAARRSSADSPRQACGSRTAFALYRCMQQQCATPAWVRHEQCLRFKALDRVDPG
jgi:serine/threonine protein kinase